MRQIKGQISLFDLMDVEKDEEEEPSFTIAEFDRLFRVGSRFIHSEKPYIAEITDLMEGEINCQIKSITNEARGWYVGERYYMNKESYGKWYLALAENGNVMPCPHKEKCMTYKVGCFGISYWCGRYGKEQTI